jgi:hypothetical protein
LKVGECYGAHPVRLIPSLRARPLLRKQLTPDFELYVSPLNLTRSPGAADLALGVCRRIGTRDRSLLHGAAGRYQEPQDRLERPSSGAGTLPATKISALLDSADSTTGSCRYFGNVDQVSHMMAPMDPSIPHAPLMF